MGADRGEPAPDGDKDGARPVRVALSGKQEFLDFIPPWKLQDDACGVVTASNSRFFYGLEMLLETIMGRVQVCVIDVGLTAYEVYLLKRRGVRVEKCPRTNEDTDETSWLKPWWIAQAGFRYTLWLDADTLVCNDLTPLFARLKEQVLLCQHAYKNEAPAAYSEAQLNKLHPVKQANRKGDPKHKDDADRLNAGVLGFALERAEDRELFEQWQMMIEQALKNPNVKGCLKFWDEGALHWAMARCALQHRLVRDQPGWDRFQYQWHTQGVDDMYHRLKIHTGDTVLHFIGKKPWEHWSTSKP